MTDRWVIALAVAAFLGALHPSSVPLVLALGATALAIVSNRRLLLVLALAALVSGLAQRSWDGLAYDPTAPGEGTAVVVHDPERRGPGHAAVIRLDGRRYLATGWGSVGYALSTLQAGDIVDVRGSVGRYGGSRERQAALHVAHRLDLHHVESRQHTQPGYGVANQLRGTITRGAAGFSSARLGLYTGLVYGDDRAQDPLVAADFRAVGLTHLLAVSGQNVAYVLVIAAPFAQRLPPGVRIVALVAVLLLFATVTRFEPSVLRASAMATLGVLGRHSGREASTLRLLAWAVTLLLVIDPLLAETVAFQLSVAASAGIALLSDPIARNVPGPRPLRDAVGVTVAAQLGVAPILTTIFGPISLATVPANVLAGPAAGLVMMWGMTGGVVAGLVPPQLASVLHLPTRVLLDWLELIARLSASWPLPVVGLAWIGAAAVAAIAVAGVSQVAGRGWAGFLGVPAVVALTLWAAAPPAGVHDVGTDSRVVLGTRAAVLVLGDEPNAVRLLDDIRTIGIRSLDLVIATRAEGIEVTDLLEDRLPATVIWAPVARGRAQPVSGIITFPIGPTQIITEPEGAMLEVRIEDQ